MAAVEPHGTGWRWFCGPCLEYSPVYGAPAEAAEQADNHDVSSWHG